MLHRWQQVNGQGQIGGYKIGCTTMVMQELPQIPSPVFGGIPANRIFSDKAELPFSQMHMPGIECEIAMRPGADLPLGGAP